MEHFLPHLFLISANGEYPAKAESVQLPTSTPVIGEMNLRVILIPVRQEVEKNLRYNPNDHFLTQAYVLLSNSALEVHLAFIKKLSMVYLTSRI